MCQTKWWLDDLLIVGLGQRCNQVRRETLLYTPQSIFCLFQKCPQWSYECTPNGVNVFERSVTLPDTSEMSLAMTIATLAPWPYPVFCAALCASASCVKCWGVQLAGCLVHAIKDFKSQTIVIFLVIGMTISVLKFKLGSFQWNVTPFLTNFFQSLVPPYSLNWAWLIPLTLA